MYISWYDIKVGIQSRKVAKLVVVAPGPQALAPGHGPWAPGPGPWAMGPGPWALGCAPSPGPRDPNYEVTGLLKFVLTAANEKLIYRDTYVHICTCIYIYTNTICTPVNKAGG